jgi:sigma-B regulation protein RsbU (phosphoserine phosphatase)
VTVTSIVDDKQLRLSVHNTGPVIPAGQLPRLFDAMTRGNAGDSSHGVGLGLFIVREIARAHGGGVTAQSSPVDGTTVGVTLPRAAPLAR